MAPHIIHNEVRRETCPFWGLCLASLPGVLWGQLHMRALQHHLLDNWDGKVNSLQEMIHFPKAVRNSFTWWWERLNLTTGRLWFPPHQILITTDTSAYSWGGAYRTGQTGNLRTSHVGSLLQSQRTYSGYESASSFLGIRKKDAQILSHNITMVTYIKRQGRTRSKPLMRTAHQLLSWTEDHLTVSVTYKRVMKHPSGLYNSNPAGPIRVGAKPRDICSPGNKMGTARGWPLFHLKEQENEKNVLWKEKWML